MDFRIAEEVDLPFVVEVYNSTIAGRMITADTNPISVDDKKEWFFQHNRSYPLWIVSEEKEIGWVSIQPFYGRPAYKDTVEISIYLKEEYRGKGLGKSALIKAINMCRELGLRTLLGFIFKHNTPSLSLFENCGFKEWGLLPEVAEMDSKFFSLSIMGLKLNK